MILLLALVLFRRHRRRQDLASPAINPFISDQLGSESLAEKGQAREYTDHQETLAVNDEGEMVHSLSPDTLEADAVQGKRQRALARFARAQPAADVETSTQASAPAAVAAVERQRHALEQFIRSESPGYVEGGRAQPAAEGAYGPADLAARLQGEIHRLRAELLEREGQEGVHERPPAYQ
jgi:hypothetical protein